MCVTPPDDSLFKSFMGARLVEIRLHLRGSRFFFLYIQGGRCGYACRSGSPMDHPDQIKGEAGASLDKKDAWANVYQNIPIPFNVDIC